MVSDIFRRQVVAFPEELDLGLTSLSRLADFGFAWIFERVVGLCAGWLWFRMVSVCGVCLLCMDYWSWAFAAPLRRLDNSTTPVLCCVLRGWIQDDVLEQRRCFCIIPSGRRQFFKKKIHKTRSTVKSASTITAHTPLHYSVDTTIM